MNIRLIIIFSIAVILLVVGLWVLQIGWTKIDESKKQSPPTLFERPECDGGFQCAGYIIVNNFESKDKTINGGFTGIIEFKTDKVFAVKNKINFTASVEVDQDNVKEFYFILQTSKFDISEIAKTDPQTAINMAENDQSLIKLTNTSENVFSKTGIWILPYPTEVRSIEIIQLKNNEYVSYTDYTKPIFVVESHLTKLQADTNISLIKQNRESESSNKLIQGLSWIGISIIPIFMAGEIFMRLFIDPHLRNGNECSGKMKNKNDDLNVEDLNPSLDDAAHGLAKGLIGLAPMAGPLLSEAFGVIVTRPIEKRMTKFMIALKNELDELKKNGKIDIRALSENDEFIDVLYQAYDLSLRTSQEEKLNALRNAILNTALGTDIQRDEKMMFLSIINDLTPTQIRVLEAWYNPDAAIKEIIEIKKQKSEQVIIPDDFSEYLKLDSTFYFVILKQLDTWNLLQNIASKAHLGIPRDMDNFSLIETIKNAVIERNTSFGSRFLKFISAPN